MRRKLTLLILSSLLSGCFDLGPTPARQQFLNQIAIDQRACKAGDRQMCDAYSTDQNTLSMCGDREGAFDQYEGLDYVCVWTRVSEEFQVGCGAGDQDSCNRLDAMIAQGHAQVEANKQAEADDLQRSAVQAQWAQAAAIERAAEQARQQNQLQQMQIQQQQTEGMVNQMIEGNRERQLLQGSPPPTFYHPPPVRSLGEMGY